MSRVRTLLLFIGLPAAVLATSAWYWLSFVTITEPRLSGALTRGELTWQDRTRTYQLYTPAELVKNPPLVLVFHGSLGNSHQARAAYGYEFEKLADKHGFVVAFPDGYEDHFNGCRKQGPYAANLLDIDDVGFMQALVQQLQEQLPIDASAVFATGISNGGQMAMRLALEAPDLVAAVAPVATSLPTKENMACAASEQPVSLLLMNGTDDPMNPYAGGTVALFGLLGDRGTVLSSQDTALYWAQLAGYSGPPQTRVLDDRNASDNSTIQVQLWQRPEAASVALYSVIGGGHNTPHPLMRTPRLFGGTNADTTAAGEIWSFFEAARANQIGTLPKSNQEK